MIRPPEKCESGCHDLCQVCDEVAALKITPSPGQKGSENHPDLSLCPVHAAHMTVGALISIGLYAETLELLERYTMELLTEGYNPSAN